ncbi:UNVERIFIED_CONTAM: hypothetical protein Slati_1555100 [Sesamum latifolium]|uniref:Uncharacterized protein n=1 Tax=Sesamum latifolium TaxID=2727402 RepID=A0AAW2XB21_9LAMI
MANAIEKQSSFGSRRHDEPEFDLKEWALRARISRGNTNSRRFSASNLKSFREDERSLRSNITISSTASSPGYKIREEIDPSKYSFTTALKGGSENKREGKQGRKREKADDVEVVQQHHPIRRRRRMPINIIEAFVDPQKRQSQTNLTHLSLPY